MRILLKIKIWVMVLFQGDCLQVRGNRQGHLENNHCKIREEVRICQIDSHLIRIVNFKTNKLLKIILCKIWRINRKKLMLWKSWSQFSVKINKLFMIIIQIKLCRSLKNCLKNLWILKLNYNNWNWNDYFIIYLYKYISIDIYHFC